MQRNYNRYGYRFIVTTKTNLNIIRLSFGYLVAKLVAQISNFVSYSHRRYDMDTIRAICATTAYNLRVCVVLPEYVCVWRCLVCYAREFRLIWTAYCYGARIAWYNRPAEKCVRTVSVHIFAVVNEQRFWLFILCHASSRRRRRVLLFVVLSWDWLMTGNAC